LALRDVRIDRREPPLVSIGLPVLNGERYLELALQSILAQTFDDFELVICDNASTDQTKEICERFAARDPRVLHHRNAHTIGGGRNANLAFNLARGKYFRWAAYDDILAPDLLRRLVDVMEACPDVVLCQSQVVLIDEDGRETGLVAHHRRPDFERWRLFADITDLLSHNCEECYGLMRASALKRTGLHRDYTDSDRTLLAHMALQGGFAEVPEPLFYRRVHASDSTSVFPEWRARMVWFGSEYADRITLPHWSQLFHYLEIIIRTPNTFGTKIRCLGFMAVWVTRYRRWRSLGKDIVLAAARLGRGHVWWRALREA